MLLSAHLFFFFTCEIARSVRIRMPVKNTFIYYIIHIIIQHTHMPWAAYRNHVSYILYTPWYRPHFFAYSSHSVNIQSMIIGCFKMHLKEKSIGLDECVDLGDKGIKVNQTKPEFQVA